MRQFWDLHSSKMLDLIQIRLVENLPEPDVSDKRRTPKEPEDSWTWSEIDQRIIRCEQTQIEGEHQHCATVKRTPPFLPALQPTHSTSPQRKSTHHGCQPEPIRLNGIWTLIPRNRVDPWRPLNPQNHKIQQLKCHELSSEDRFIIIHINLAIIHKTSSECFLTLGISMGRRMNPLPSYELHQSEDKSSFKCWAVLGIMKHKVKFSVRVRLWKFQPFLCLLTL